MARVEPAAGTTVVVGIDEPDRNRGAIRWAAAEAALRGVPVRLVHAFLWPLLRIPPVVTAMGPPDGLRAQAEDLLEEAAEIARAAAPEVGVETYVRTAFPDELLAAESHAALYVVIGSRGLSTFGRVLTGSTTLRLIVRSRCPVAVVGDRLPVPGINQPVVVGVDGSAHSLAAVETAVDLASRWRTELQVVHVARSLLAGAPLDIDWLVSPWRGSHPGTSIRTFLLEGRPGRALLELSKASRAVVVGARGIGGVSSLLIGSVSQALISGARCPVVVVPSRAGRQQAE